MDYLIIAECKLPYFRRRKEFRSLSNLEKVVFKGEDELPKKLGDIKLKKGDTIFLAGGDGTANITINIIINIYGNLVEKLNFKILPFGKANDLWREIKSRVLSKKRLVKVNNEYLLTGGGFGLLTQVVETHNASNLKNFFGGLSYYLSTLRRIIVCSKMEGVKINKRELDFPVSLIAIMNQEHIGKRFNLSKKMKPGKVSICFLKYEKSLFKRLKQFYLVSKGMQFNKEWFFLLEEPRFDISFNKLQALMVDGELRFPSNNFKISLDKRVINLEAL